MIIGVRRLERRRISNSKKWPFWDKSRCTTLVKVPDNPEPCTLQYRRDCVQNAESASSSGRGPGLSLQLRGEAEAVTILWCGEAWEQTKQRAVKPSEVR